MEMALASSLYNKIRILSLKKFNLREPKMPASKKNRNRKISARKVSTSKKDLNNQAQLRNASPVKELMIEKAQNFRKSYLDVSKSIFINSGVGTLYHAGEFGQYRENLVKSLMSLFLPGGIGLGSGFIADRSGHISTQVDLIAYDENEAPKIEDMSTRRFFPVETIVGIGEVKSTVSFSELKDHLDKLSAVKKLCTSTPQNLVPSRPSWRVQEIVGAQQDLQRELGRLPSPDELRSILIESFDPCEHHWQAKFSFLVCSEFDFGDNIIEKKLLEIIKKSPGPDDRAFALRHNGILSVKDGYQSYFSPEIGDIPYPRYYSHNLQLSAATGMTFVKADENCSHIIAFASDFASAVADTASYPFNASNYAEVKRDRHAW